MAGWEEIHERIGCTHPPGCERCNWCGFRSMEQRVKDWVISRMGIEQMHPLERSRRNLEESVELAQAEGATEEEVLSQVRRVYGRPVGNPLQEAGGVAVCVLAYCASRGKTFNEIAMKEIERIEAKPPAEIRDSLAQKVAAGLSRSCPHDRLDMDGICHGCGRDCRGGS